MGTDSVWMDVCHVGTDSVRMDGCHVGTDSVWMDGCHVGTDSVLQWGETALHCAASEGHPTVVKMLLSAGAQTDIRDKVSSN